MKRICQLYMPSFFRSYGNNALREATGLLKTLKKAGFSGVYLIALWEDGGYDNGFDIVEYAVNPLVGTHEDLRNLIAEAHKLDLLVGADVVPNHVSDRNILAQNCLHGMPGFEDCLYVVTHREAERLTEAGVPSFFGKLAYSDFGDKYVRSTFADHHQLNLNWKSLKVQEYFSWVFANFKSLTLDFARIDCGMMLLEDVSKARPDDITACFNPAASVEAVRKVSWGIPLFFEWFNLSSIDVFDNLPECYAVDCSYVLDGVQNLEWHHPKLVPLVGGHDQMTLADRGLDAEKVLAKMEPSEYGFLDMQTLLGWKTDPRVLPGDQNYDADLKNINQRYRARRPIKPVLEEFLRRYN